MNPKSRQPAQSDTSRIEAVILAGGRGRRMGGADKGLLPLQGRPLVAHVQAALQAQVARLVISANRNRRQYAALSGVEVCADRWEDFRGPLAGIDAGFAATMAPWLLAVPADMPGLPDDLVAQLRAGLADGTRAVYAQIDGDPVYPLCLLHRELAADLHDSVQRGEHAVGLWLRRHTARAVAIHGWAALPRNLNTPERLCEAQGAAAVWMHE